MSKNRLETQDVSWKLKMRIEELKRRIEELEMQSSYYPYHVPLEELPYVLPENIYRRSDAESALEIAMLQANSLGLSMVDSTDKKAEILHLPQSMPPLPLTA